MQSRGVGTRFQCAGGEKTLGFFASGEDDDDDERARLAGVGGMVNEVERGRVSRVGVGSLAERVMKSTMIDRQTGPEAKDRWRLGCETNLPL